jgi:hypothetical protein
MGNEGDIIFKSCMFFVVYVEQVKKEINFFTDGDFLSLKQNKERKYIEK